MSTAVLRRYTPPTCTLEISAIGSALSRWTDRQVMKNVRFALHLDDPKLSPEQQVTIRGDRLQLDALCEAVGTYVQQLLDPHALEQQPLLQRLRSEGGGATALKAAELNATLAKPAVQNGRLSDGSMPQTLRVVDSQGGSAVADSNQAPLNTDIFLEPRGLLSHDLHLGSLATTAATATVHLSATQLFDLANALDSYAADALVLPELARPAWVRPTGPWLRAVAGLVLAVGATATVVRFVTDLQQPQIASAPQAETAPAASVPTTGNLPTEPNSNLDVPPPPPPGALSKVPQGFPSPTQQGPLRPVIPGQGNLPRPAMIVPPPQTGGGVVRVPARVPVAQGRAVPQRPSIAIAPPAQPPRASAGTAARVRPSTPSAVPAPSLSVEQGAGVASVPELSQLPAGESNATVPNDAVASARRAPSSSSDNSEAASLSMSQMPVTPQANLPRISQVQEAQAFFESRWQPQEGIQQTLEYRLVVAPDGTIAQITPLNDTAGASVDRTGIPLTGEPFVSPIDGGKTALMRLVLSPDGSVQTFLEGLN